MEEPDRDDKKMADVVNGRAEDTDAPENSQDKTFVPFYSMGLCIFVGVFITASVMAAWTAVSLLRELRVKSEDRISSVMDLAMKPRDETRTFQFAKLANGIEVVTVMDSRALQKAFANAVESGSFDEPVKLPGLAHFCEHMLFLGTSKYNDPSGFDNFLSAHGGGSNAYTADEATVYFATVDQAVAAEGLDRFADFFKTPLLSTKYVDKEVHAIDSEHAKNIQDPTWQVQSVLQSLASPGSPLSHFHTGDVETLMTDPKNAKPPIDTVEALREYWKTHYCPERMKVVTTGSETNAQQLKLIEQEFGGLRAKSEACEAKRPKFDAPNPWPPERMQKWVNIQGMRPGSYMKLQFWLPDVSKAYASQPLDYIEYVLMYGGEGSLHRILTDSLGLASSMGVDFDGSSAGTQMYISFQLTTEGRANTELLLDVIFAYLAVLNRDGVQGSLYDSLATMDKMAWDWGGQDGPTKTVEDLAERMTRVEPEDLLWADTLIKTPDPQLVTSLIKRLTPGNMIAAFVNGVSRNQTATNDTLFKGQHVQTLPHYGVQFSVQEMQEVLEPGSIARWHGWLDGTKTITTIKASIEERVKDKHIKVVPNSGLIPKYPQKIDGIPPVLQIKHMYAATSAYSDTQTIDTLLYGPTPSRLDLHGLTGSPYGKDAKVWYRSGWMIQSPKVKLTISLRPLKTADEPDNSALEHVQLALYGRLLSQEISPKLVDLTNSGMSYDISVGVTGFEFEFVGFAPNMPMLIKQVLSEFNTFNKDQSLTPEVRWERQKHNVREDLQTYDDLPVKYAIRDRNELMQKGSKSRAELLTALDEKEISLKSSVTSVSDLLLSRQLQLTTLAMGNLDENDARTMIGDFVKSLDSPKKVKMSQNADAKVEFVTPVVNISAPVEVRKLNPRLGDKNDVAVVSIVSGVSTVESRVILGLIGQILGTSAYNELRTSQQLGYVANGGVASISNTQALSVLVQGDRLDADDMAASIHYVLTDVMPRRLQELTDKELNAMKASLRHDILQPPMKYKDEFAHFAVPVDRGGLGFDHESELLKYLDGPMATKETLRAEWDRLVLPEEGQRKVVTMKYFANEKSLSPPTLEQAKEKWAKHRVPANAIALLEREFKLTNHLTKVDSQESEKLAKEGGYFSTDLHLKLKDATRYQSPVHVPQQIKDIIARRTKEIDAFVDTPIQYATTGTLKAVSGDRHRNMRAYSTAPRGSFALVTDS